MFLPQLLMLFVGLSFAAPLTSENTLAFDRRGTEVCNVRYGWSLSAADCHDALGLLPVTSISVGGRPVPLSVPRVTPPRTGQGVTGLSSSPVLTRLRDAHGFTAKSGKCVIGVKPPSDGGINLSDWTYVAAGAFNIIINCVSGEKGKGGMVMAGPLKNIEVMVWQEEPE